MLSLSRCQAPNSPDTTRCCHLECWADADLFVSIHCNAHSSQAYGTETFVLGEKNTGRNFEVAKRENEVIFLEENYEENYAGFDPSSPESTIAIGIEQEV